jgi:hypothetical protein
MPELIDHPSRVTAAGEPPDYISVCLPAFAPDTVHRDE